MGFLYLRQEILYSYDLVEDRSVENIAQGQGAGNSSVSHTVLSFREVPVVYVWGQVGH